MIYIVFYLQLNLVLGLNGHHNNFRNTVEINSNTLLIKQRSPGVLIEPKYIFCKLQYFYNQEVKYRISHRNTIEP